MYRKNSSIILETEPFIIRGNSLPKGNYVMYAIE